MADQVDSKLVRHTSASYGDSFNAHLLEQYKLYVQSAENVSARRVSTNRYLLTLSAALVAAYGFGSTSFGESWWMLGIPIAGFLVSVLWFLIIKSHADLNRVKFVIIHELEGYLPAAIYKYEWRLAEEGRGETYQETSKIESWVPYLFAGLHGSLAMWIVFENSGVRDLVG